MQARTVDWAAGRIPESEGPAGEGLRERKKRLMRQRLSDTATRMFLERGFDAVRVAEVAEACGVSEKTVFNYFATKESLVLDRWDTTIGSLRTGLAEPGVAPVEATLRILDGELGSLTTWLATQADPADAGDAIRRFADLIRTTPALRAHQRDMLDRLGTVAAEVLAGRGRCDPDDPEVRIAATALLGLWQIQADSLTRHLAGGRSPAQVRTAVTADVHRAARLIATGLADWSPPQSGRN